MSDGTIIFVHGAGVRLRNYNKVYRLIEEQAKAHGLRQTFVACAWGDPVGSEFAGKSIPSPPSLEQLQREANDYAEWNWLFDDPLFELYMLTILDKSPTNSALRPDELPEWEILWDQITIYKPSVELQLLLTRGGMEDLWPRAWAEVVTTSPIPRAAFKASSHELADVTRALARSLIAQLHVLATDEHRPGPSRALRTALLERLLHDWQQSVLGLGSYAYDLFKRAATRFINSRLRNADEAFVHEMGDILLYQSRGAEIREFIRRKIFSAVKPVTLLAHSLGSVACFDLLALPSPPDVNQIVTIGSQVPFIYEIGALYSLSPKESLSNRFPRWLNIYDRNDFLSFVARPLFPSVDDFEVSSGQPFPDSHSAYFGNDATWRAIRAFIDKT